MSHPEAQRIPAWAHRERASDLAWIQENLHLLWPAAQHAFREAGRGAIVSDTTLQISHPHGSGHPFIYLALSEVEAPRWADVLRLVKGYDPTWEFVAVLLKSGRESAYRIGIPTHKRT